MELLFVFIAGFCASYIGSLVSGTMALVSMTSLLFIGIPSGIALSTLRFWTFGFHFGSFFQYLKAKQIDWSIVLPLSILASTWALIGSHIVVNIDEEILKKMMAIIILIFIPITLVNRKMWVDKVEVSKIRKYIGFFLFFLASIWSSSFVVGIWIFMIYIYLNFFGFTILQAKWTDRVPSLFLETITLIVFILNDLVDYKLWALFLTGAIIGSWFWAKMTLKIGDKNLRYFLILAIIVLMIKYLFF